MGQEISDSRFSEADFLAFQERLRVETALLDRWFHEGRFAVSEAKGGFELEAWLVDRDARPAGVNQAYLERLDSVLVVPELATFNVEINGSPQPLRGRALSLMAEELAATWGRCNRVAGDFDARLAMVGILPTVTPADLCLANMSPLQRYRALNEQVLRLRQGRPLEVDIQGREHLRMQHRDVMLESAATSFQIHLKVSAERGARYYNASKILSAPMVALAANSPFLFGRSLWEETRIPLFEQSVAVGASDLTKRVTFGIRYAHRSLMECFEANLARYPVILPQLMEEPPERLAHLRLHNGTIWRWNRPLIGFDRGGAPHLRIEHRVAPAGPTIPDMIANAAFYFGAARALVDMEIPPEQRLPFEQARDNFYAAARAGLEARVAGFDGARGGIDAWILDTLLPLAEQGLNALGIDPSEIDIWLGIIEERVRSGQTGAAWQRAWVRRHGPDMQGLAEAYLDRQASGTPVATWR